MMQVWEIQLFKNERWVTELRYYFGPKEGTAFDLHDIEGKRRGATLIKILQR